MFWHRREDKSFLAVAMVMILLGAAIFAFGVVGWLVNISANTTLVMFPSFKIIGGLVVIALGYIQLELSLIRNKK